jgi:protein dithiol:quinone oxidoreductase
MWTPARLRLTPRLGYAAGFFACAGLIGFAYYLQYWQGEEPCPLCIFQRVVFFVLTALFLAAALHGPARVGAAVYGGLLVVAAGIGAAIAGRHVWLQNLPPEQVPVCGPGLDLMLSRYPLTEVLQRVLAGTGECAEVGWTFLSVSIAGWALVWFVLLGAWAAILTVAALRRV